MTLTGIPNLKTKPYGGCYSVYDSSLCEVRDEAIKTYSHASVNFSLEKHHFFDQYRDWMFSSHPNIKGVQQYQFACFTNGTSESFAHFYLRYREDRRLRLARGEYFYHQMMHRLFYSDRFAWLDEDEIREGDFVLISVPFGDTGNVPDGLEQLLCDCDEKQVPVMLDLAYINLAVNLSIDLSHPCIEYVVSSLSKVFPVEHFRIGIRLQRTMFEDQIYVINEDLHDYINYLSIRVGSTMMNNFSADWLHKTYKTKQQEFCEKLNLTPSSCVTLGIDLHNQYPEYSRGGPTNRLCFSRVWDGRMKGNDNA